MAEPILIYGKSGSGKSRSLKNFEKDEILFINVISKRLPFQKKFDYELKTSNYELIKEKLSKMPCKVAVIDDSGLSLTYGNLCNYADELKKALPHRTLVFILAENRIGSLVGYTSFLSNRVVPLVLSNNTEKSLFDNLFENISVRWFLSKYGIEQIATLGKKCDKAPIFEEENNT